MLKGVGRLEQIKFQILQYLMHRGIEEASFVNEGDNKIFPCRTVLKIRVREEEKNRWEYFARRAGEKGICSARFVKDVLEIRFNSSDTESGKSALQKEIEEIYLLLVRGYHLVAPRRKQFSVLIKPTHRCNMSCRYCYEVPYRNKVKSDLNIEVLDKFVKLLADYAEKVHVIWHGGEPTMVGVEWYEKAYQEVFAKYPMVEFTFGLQTNGLNINEEWIDLFKKYCIHVGISYNAYHQSRLRGGMSDDCDVVLQNIKLCRDRGLRAGVIDVISAANYKEQIAIYEFYKNLGIGVCMNQVFYTPEARKHGLEVSAQEYSKEFLRYFKHWLYDRNGVDERSAREALCFVAGIRQHTCRNNDCRWQWLGLNADGSVYPCDRYYPEKYRIGNVMDFTSIDEIFASDGYKVYAEEVQKRFDTLCKDCGYWDVCRGGCNASAVECTGSAEGVEEFSCELFRLNFKGVYEILRDVDIVEDENLNPVARRILAEGNFYSVKDIRHYLNDTRVNLGALVYDPDNLLECNEFQVFRGINQVKDLPRYGPPLGHVDFVDSRDELSCKRNHQRRKEKLFWYLKEVSKCAFRSKCVPDSGFFGNS